MKFAKGKLEKDYEETERIRKETEKLELEKKLLIQEIENNDSIENAYKKSLDIQSAEEDLKRKRIENALLELELMQKGSVALAELLARGIISQKQFTMSINGLPFLAIKNGQLTQGENINIIDKL